MGNNMCPSTIAIGEKHTYFISTHYQFIENEKIEEGTFLNARNRNLHPFLYHLGKCSVASFKKLEPSQIHSCWPHKDEEDENVDLVLEDEDDVLFEEDVDVIESIYCNGNIKMLENFN